MKEARHLAPLGLDVAPTQVRRPLIGRGRRLYTSVSSYFRGFVDRSPRENVIGIATVLGFTVPALAYLVFVQRYAVNVVVADQWSNVSLAGKAFSGHLNVADLWAQHNENRMFFPNLVALVLAYSTHMDVVSKHL